MMCQRIGRPPISIIGFGLRWDSSLMRVPKPPARMTAFMTRILDGRDEAMQKLGLRHAGAPLCPTPAIVENDAVFMTKAGAGKDDRGKHGIADMNLNRRAR